DGQVGVDARRLGDVTDAAAQFGAARGQAQHGDRAGLDDLGADDRAHQGGLPAAGGPEQSGDRAARDAHAHALEGSVGAAPDVQVADVDGVGDVVDVHGPLNSS